MNWSLVRAIVILPGTVLVYVPALILWAADGTELTAVSVGVREPRMWSAVLLGLAGFGLAISTVRLLLIVGEGTPAPWNPPLKLVVRGPYRLLALLLADELPAFVPDELIFREPPARLL